MLVKVMGSNPHTCIVTNFTGLHETHMSQSKEVVTKIAFVEMDTEAADLDYHRRT